ncbi:MAG: KH domain-containing protein [Candidatus Aenigmatarchaeota archaeon]|nr:KH domain-containing protein [Candidatus Aenigmarchaeota archaeon]
MKEVVMIPADRVGVLTQPVRDEIEKRLGVKVNIIGNSVELDGEGIELQTAMNMIKAIGRGFAPERAYRLFEEDQLLEIIDIGGFSEARAATIRSRIIGTKGRMRKRIEDASGAAVSVYGKTIAIIGTWEQVNMAKKAVEMLIGGAMHSSVEKFLLRARK